MSAKPRLTFRGLAPGECPSVVVEIPLDGKHDELVELLTGRLAGVVDPPRGNEPLMPLTTRGGRG